MTSPGTTTIVVPSAGRTYVKSALDPTGMPTGRRLTYVDAAAAVGPSRYVMDKTRRSDDAC